MAQKQSKILIVENDLPVAHTLELKLSKAGYLTKVVTDGEEALVTLEKEKYDLILLDLVLPKMDGFDFLAKLSSNKFASRVLVLTNLSQDEDVKRAKDLGAEHYYIKANTPIVKVVDKIQELLG